MDRAQIIERVNSINKELGQGSQSNPAHIDNSGKIILHSDHLDKEQKEEIVGLIGDWDFNRQSTIREQLVKERDKLHSELKELL